VCPTNSSLTVHDYEENHQSEKDENDIHLCIKGGASLPALLIKTNQLFSFVRQAQEEFTSYCVHY
jgi:hypothetical protein